MNTEPRSPAVERIFRLLDECQDQKPSSPGEPTEPFSKSCKDLTDDEAFQVLEEILRRISASGQIIEDNPSGTTPQP